jgi:hypothetical protein
MVSNIGSDNEIIRRSRYFRRAGDEVRGTDAHPSQTEVLNQRMPSREYYEEKRLEKQDGLANTHFASAALSEAGETR